METGESRPYDVIIIGAGPGGLQAGIHLGRYNFRVLLLDRSGGRTRHARHLENYLGILLTTGADLVETGLRQVRSFGVRVELRTRVVRVTREDNLFLVETREGGFYRARFVVVSTGLTDKLPEMEGLSRFFARSFFSCVDCDGYRTTGRKLVVLGNHINTVRLAFAMQRMYTDDVTLVLLQYEPPEDYREELSAAGIELVKGRPRRLVGGDELEALELHDGRRVPCQVIMSNFGSQLNDAFLQDLPLKRDGKRFKILTDRHARSSVEGLYVVGPLNQGSGQVVTAAGEGAAAAMDIKKRILEI